jgi:glycosyltransferase involved in cell wall biosynthesis
MVLYDPQEFGGLEEYAATLAIGLQQRGHQVSVLSTTWAPPDNQYLRRLREHKVTVVQVPKWLSRPASHWPTKMRILAALVWLAGPLNFLLAGVLFLRRRCSWRQALTSAHGWLQGQLLSRFIGPDRYKPLARWLLNWWRWRWRPDLLHIQGYTRTLLFVIDWAATKNLPVVYEEHQTPDARFDWWQGFAASINQAARVIAVSETSAQALRIVCGVTQPIVVRNPLLPDPVASGWQKETHFPSGDEPLRITTVARLVEALRQELLDYARQLGLAGEEIFVGAFTTRQELSRLMAHTDIFVMSSLLEGQPLSVVEAMSYGCPIVTTSVGGIPELIKDGVNGLLCQSKDPECLARNIRLLLEQPALRMQLGEAARRTYEQGPFQPAAVCDHFISIYREVLRTEQPEKGDSPNLTPSFES